jgi:hypothetical protein
LPDLKQLAAAAEEAAEPISIAAQAEEETEGEPKDVRRHRLEKKIAKPPQARVKRKV